MRLPFPSLRVQWSGLRSRSGLVRATLKVPRGQAAALTLEIDGQPAWEVTVPPGHDGRVRLNLHTHLLADGEHLVCVHRRSGALQRRSPRRRLYVDHDSLLGHAVRASLRRNDVPLAFVGDCDARHHEDADPSLTHWIDRPEAPAHIDALLADALIAPDEAVLLRRFVRDGYVVLDQTLTPDQLREANAALDDAVRRRHQGYVYGQGTRLEKLHQRYPAIRELWLHPGVNRFLSLVFDAPAQPCQSLAYVFGSEQDAHQDTIHLTPFPAGRMCGVWFALEDVRPGSGELLVYPGSHRLPRVYLHQTGCAKVRDDWSEFGRKVVARWSEMIREAGLQPAPYLPRAGQILVWHENLMHGGSVRADPALSRRSVVTHHFARDAIVHYDSTGEVGQVHAGR